MWLKQNRDLKIIHHIFFLKKSLLNITIVVESNIFIDIWRCIVKDL